MSYHGVIERYRAYLPQAIQSAQAIALAEGNTPLLAAPQLAQALNFKGQLYLKYEGANPTGSFKDRGMTVAMTHAKQQGLQAVMCASTGNTSASAAAYCARAGMQAFVLIPEGKIARGKLAQAMIHGAVLIQLAGNFDDGMRLVKEITQSLPIALVNSVNPYRLQGQKTAAFEIIDTLGCVPDYHYLPVGNAGNISAYGMGYLEYLQAGQSDKEPIMVGYQAAGAAPFVAGHVIAKPETVATAIRIGAPQSWDLAQNVVQRTKGWFGAIEDQHILNAQTLIAQSEGIFCEPASAAAVAGLEVDVAAGKIAADATVVCTLTGHGLKDPDLALNNADITPHRIDVNAAALQDLVTQYLR